MAKTKNTYEQEFFDLGFCRHLIWADELQEARELIEKNIKKIPDESLYDLLPADNASIDQLSGQYLKINYLKLLKKVSIDHEKQKVLENLALLQPLNIDIIEQVQNNSKKYKHFYKILKGEWIETKEDNFYFTQILDYKTAKKIEHPLASQNKLLTKLQKWLIYNEKENFELIKQYAENFDEKKYPVYKSVLDKITRFYGIDKAEAYIGYGQKSTEFNIFDNKTPFLLIGKNFLEENNILKLTTKEFAFLAALEYANLFLGYSYITSSDIWKGATQKGIFVADTLLSIIPFTGVLGSVLKNASKMEKISKWAMQMEKIGQWGQSGIAIFKSSVGIVEKASQNKETELLLQSRLMQINADRLALLVAGDIVSAFSAILKTHYDYDAIKQRISTTGLIAFLSEKTTDGKLKQRDFALRMAALASFYLSNEFDYWFSFFRKKHTEQPWSYK